MAWSEYDRGLFVRKFQEFWGDQSPKILEIFSSRLQVFDAKAVLAALDEVALRQEGNRRGRPSIDTIMGSIESSGAKAIWRKACMVCGDVQTVPIEIFTIEPDHEALRIMPQSLFLRVVQTVPETSRREFAIVDLRIVQNLEKVSSEKHVAWCGSCCPGSVSPLFRGPELARKLVGKFRLYPGYEHLAGDLQRILDGRAIDGRFGEPDPKIGPKEFAADDAAWEQLFDRASTEEILARLKWIRSRMRLGEMPELVSIPDPDVSGGGT